MILQIAGFPSENFLINLNDPNKEYLNGLSIKPERVNFMEYFGRLIPNQQGNKKNTKAKNKTILKFINFSH